MNDEKRNENEYSVFPYCQHSLLIPSRCLGLRLLPFSLGHIDMLTALKSPIVSDTIHEIEAKIKTVDMAVAVWVCSRKYEKAIQQYRSGRAQRDMEKLGRKWGRNPAALAAQRIVFIDYLKTYFMAPPRRIPETQRQPSLPWHLSVFVTIPPATLYTPSEVWNMPLPRALELFAAIGVNAGDASLIPMNQTGAKQ